MTESNDVSLREHIEALLAEHEKAHVQLAKSVEVALAAQNDRLNGMNEFRQSLEDFQHRAVSRELFDQRGLNVDTRLGTIERSIVGREVFNREVENLDGKIDVLRSWQNKAAGAAVILAIVAGTIGALILKLFGG